MILVLALPSILITLVFSSLFARWQAQFSRELNWASAKMIGFGVGILLHLSCWIGGGFQESFHIVKNRIREFFSDFVLSPKMAFTWYKEDIKANGVVFWINLSIVLVNIWVFVDATLDLLAILGLAF